MKRLGVYGRLRLAYQAFRHAHRLPYRLVTGTEVHIGGELRPSQIEGVMTVWVHYINERGEDSRRQVSLFS